MGEVFRVTHLESGESATIEAATTGEATEKMRQRLAERGHRYDAHSFRVVALPPSPAPGTRAE